jgi:hypothetical protein
MPQVYGFPDPRAIQCQENPARASTSFFPFEDEPFYADSFFDVFHGVVVNFTPLDMPIDLVSSDSGYIAKASLCPPDWNGDTVLNSTGHWKEPGARATGFPFAPFPLDVMFNSSHTQAQPLKMAGLFL